MRIMAWFYDEIKHELLLWIYGPAGVGKSAIVQTLAEVLASAGCLGASVFFSRPSARNYSHSVFITVAYQLAVHIEPYCSFICELLAFDPEVVNKSMEEQFRAFIVEPFVQKNIGKGGKPLGILLDGLDELDHQHQQQKIIHLITGFVQNHPEVPLVWEEYVPIDSPEACQDVERYLRNSFETIQKVNFPHIVHTGWPEEKKMVKLAHAALGLFAFADVAIRFVGDPNHVDPVTRLDDVLSVIDGSKVGSADDQPFAHLDALYTCILTRIPSKMWPITQRVLAAVPEVAHLSYNLRCVYASINNLYSLLDVPPLGDVYSRKLHFHHASFLDFLRDATRSKKFYTSSWTAKRDFRESGVRIWQDFKRQSSAGPKESLKGNQDHCGSNMTATDSAPPSIVIVTTEAHRGATEVGSTRNDALNHDAISTTASVLHNDARSIIGTGHEVRLEAPDISANATGGIFTNARHVILNNPLMVDNSTKFVMQGADNKASKAKELLLKHMIPGAAHDSSARDPPPLCHPGTRIKINERIIDWFYDEMKQELILWISGPAGVGKSAIVQTFAAKLALAGLHIKSYCAFVSELLAFDPEIVNKSMEEQFKAFIVKPFVEKKVRVGGKTWGVFLDGLDELDKRDRQGKIIQLITAFAHDHPEVPLAWVISSRPEPHITNTFKQRRLNYKFKEEYVE
ncbi:hypothetical protein AGABI2DRAFT_123104 [Agaricus bisporus var. bisporus H97]|uniref:hypothetical protein n=1 Tax=Agaricus bisporus var. bisporus (strain H97 / ATCC MYA-4626 / FGSC 10389) TaxID=936046 RepID=UPI00029F609A|nr:hypothetical protein AGABI2DRAFT_123104 [Agaricus bisporus var. bisporus H97]EKV41984.1 hypothetical protein AGABI2DRAFT_123104 [Agaricus bisporus var. bisporus H97]